jgi:hypothetical protein
MTTHTLLWKADWPQAKANLARWWRREGLVLCLTSARPGTREGISRPADPPDLETLWLDLGYRAASAEYAMASQDFHAEAFPYFDTEIGPGSLGLFLGAGGRLAADTVWYDPCLTDPESGGTLRFDPQGNPWWDRHLALIETALRRADGRYLVGIPDLIENMDTLAALRGSELLLYDLVERPGWVHERLAEINKAFFEVFDIIYNLVKDGDGGNAFSAFRIWGPGKTAKLQCDFSAMISPRMFRQFVVPPLAAQCRWLDYSLYHLDGTTAVQHLDALLEIEALDAIEWTPQAGKPHGGSPEWYDLYRRIKAGGKGVQAIDVHPEDVLPLLDAIGPQGTFILVSGVLSEKETEEMIRAVEPYRS